jgi:hypothetical protein
MGGRGGDVKPQAASNIGQEYWNAGILSFSILFPIRKPILPIFHHSIIPGIRP